MLSSIKSDAGVSQFSKEIEKKIPDQDNLKQAKIDFQRELIKELFDFRVLQYRITGCIKRSRENASSLLTDPSPIFQQILDRVKGVIFDTAEKFQLQLRDLMNNETEPELNLELQERIKKAARYFSEKIDALVLKKISNIPIDTDNRQVKKRLSEAINNLQLEVIIKLACLNACKEGFKFKELMDARSKAAIEEPKRRKSQAGSKTYSTDNIENRELFEILRRWRNLEAEEQNVPAYRILTQKALVGIAAELPSSAEAMTGIKGIGKRTAQTYGVQVMEILADYCQQHNLEYRPNFKIEFSEKKKKATKTETKKLSYDLFKNGKSIQEIALDRSLSVNTVEGHLAYFIEKGELEISEFLTEEEIDEIIGIIGKMENQYLSPLKEALHHKYDYGVLKMAMAYYRSHVL
jgi:hypothetical protein